ncbi:MAG: ABC transporter ATP-binding protein [Rhizobacter sp.]
MKFLVSALATAAACTVVPALAQTTPPPSAAAASTTAAPVSKPASLEASPGGDRWRVMASPYTIHYSHDEKHKPVWMVGLERERADGLLLGAVYFSNSFGQPSGFVYGGQRLYDFSPYPQLFAQWTAGVMYGYRGEFKDKVPFNYGGFSPGVVLALGWQFTPRYSVQANVLGNSALMFQFAVDF